MSFSDLLNQTLITVKVTEDEIIFVNKWGEIYKMFHEQDCCEDVHIESIVGDWSDLINTPILLASEEIKSAPGEDASKTWTFYKLGSVKGYVDIRWIGSSNGWYSERVSFQKITDLGLI